jgi:hypothetical protein
MGLSDFPKNFIPPRKRYSAVVPSPSSSSSPPTSVENKPEPNSDNQSFDDELVWSPSWVRHLEDRMTSRIQCDDNESVLIRKNPEACKVFNSDEFKKTGTSSSTPSSSKLVVRYRNHHHSHDY